MTPVLKSGFIVELRRTIDPCKHMGYAGARPCWTTKKALLLGFYVLPWLPFSSTTIIPADTKEQN